MTSTMSDAEKSLAPKGMLIGGEWITKGSLGEIVHINPSTGREHPPVPHAGEQEVDSAVRAAKDAQRVWWSMTADQRRDALLALADSIRRATPELAALNALDNGCPTRIGASFPMAAADHFTYYAGWADKITGDVIPTWPGQALDYALMEPYGVIGEIIPWNMPMFNVGQVVASALAAGNAVVFKAPDLAPFTVLRFAELVAESGLPAGLVNVLPGDGVTGAAMVAHTGIDKISFIGGGLTARAIMKSAADTLKPVTFELGGKSANIVFPDADLRASAGQAAFQSMGMTGQACLSASRLFVHEDVYEPFVGGLKQVIATLQVGDPFVEGTMIGPVINSSALDRIMGVIEAARAAGHSLLMGGDRLGGDLSDGFFVAPTVFADLDNSSDLAQNEVFGPVLSVMKFSDEDEVVAMANDSAFGLASYVHTNDLKRAHRVAATLQSGSVWVNGSGVRTSAPFGGVKQSGFGRMGGRFGLEDFMYPKNVHIPLA